MSLFNRKCREVTRLILERKDRRLTAIERIAVRLHLSVCRMCTRFSAQVRLMDQAMGRWKAYAEHGDPDDSSR
ncbi:MAG: zf-HC2 domain-containing protein [Burkholderiaceae bacterium]